MDLCTFAGNNNWKLSSNCQNRDLDDIEPIVRSLHNEMENVCSIESNNNITRIGSDSGNAQVYKLVLSNGKSVALKLIPEKMGMDIILREIKYSVRASEAVVACKCPYFPIIYEYGKCHNMKLQEGNLLSELVDDYGYDEDSLAGMFIVMELASYDLIHWLKFEHSLQQWVSMLMKILDAVHFMNTDLNILHMDLFCKNIVVGDKDIPLIIDFGISKDYDTAVNEGLSKSYDFNTIFSDVYSYIDGIGEKEGHIAKVPLEIVEFFNNYDMLVGNLEYDEYYKTVRSALFLIL